MSGAAAAARPYVEPKDLCARRACPESATLVPVICFHAIRDGKNVEHRTAPLTSFAQCRDCARGLVKVDELLGAGQLTRLCDEIEAGSGRRPLGGVVEWQPLR